MIRLKDQDQKQKPKTDQDMQNNKIVTSHA